MKIQNKNIHLIVTVLFFLILCLFIIALKIKDINADKEQIYLINKGETINSLAVDLKNKKLITSKNYFKIIAKITNTDINIKAGYYKIDEFTSIYDFLSDISAGKIAISQITLVEGHTIEQYYQQLSNNPYVFVDKKLAQVMKEIDVASPYEGWLFPDTYAIKYGDNIASIFNKAHKKMQHNLNLLWQQRDKSLPYKNPYEAIILASLIEKETAYNEEKADIAAVFINRLNKNMLLQSDVSVIYALGNNYDNKLAKQDIKFKSPYNTYLHYGLPAGAISSVGYKSLYAAFHPANNDYIYFVSKKDGTHAFANNYQQHKKNIERYLKK